MVIADVLKLLFALVKLLLPIQLNNPDDLGQRVIGPFVQDTLALVVLPENNRVGVISRLLTSLLVVNALGNVLTNRRATRNDPHQAWHHHPDR